MADLTKLVNDYVRLDALSRIKKRVWVVGRFNQKNPGNPDSFLFTDRQIDDDYREQFTQKLPLTYDAFVTALQPAMSEKLTKKGRLNAVETTIPRDEADLDESNLTIDAFNYFFKRAIANSKQPEFETKDKSPQLLEGGDSARGGEILRQIRDNLTRFCEFQPHNHELVHGAAHLIASAQGDAGLPAGFFAGHPLPSGFPEVVLDFLYDEDTTRGFEMGYIDRLDFGGNSWREMTDEGRGTFSTMMNAYRNYLVYGNADDFFATQLGGSSLPDLVDGAIGRYDGLQKRFGGAKGSRTAYNSLRQIVRSKVLLSMVLEWVLQSLHELDSVRKEKLPGDKYDAMEAAVESGSDGLAKPKVRATPEEREKFSDSLGQNFATILEAIVDDGAKVEVPEAFKGVVANARADADQVAALRAVSGHMDGGDMFSGFVDACRTILVDVLCENLYQSPTIDAQTLRRYFRRETTSVYLTAIFLADENVEQVLRIAEGNLEDFERRIENGVITKPEEIQKVLLAEFVEVLADERLKRQLEDGLSVLRRVQALNEVADASLGHGAGRVAVPRTSAETEDGDEGVLRKTDSGKTVVKAALVKKIKSRHQEAAAKASAAAAGGDGSPAATATATADAPADRAAPTPSPEAGQDPAPEAQERDSADADDAVPEKDELDEEIELILGAIGGTDDAPVEEVIEAAQSSDAFEEAVVRLSDDVKAYEATLDLIYRRYNDHTGKKMFRNKVERMTLINMMLLWQKDLGLGKVQSNLYSLLLDLVLELDPEDPDPMQFLRRRSLTQYFDNQKLGKGWVGSLRNVLELQAVKSLETVVSFVSELRGVFHLFNKLKNDKEAEIVVVNADADEFLKWLHQDNLTGAQGDGRLRAVNLRSEGVGDPGAWPAMIYMTDIAFDSSHGRKVGWLRQLSNIQLVAGDFKVVPPPVCVSTSAQFTGAGEQWQREGQELAKHAEESKFPVVVLGPSPLLNKEGDSFSTILPAGYLLACRVLGVQAQGLRIENVNPGPTQGRFAVLFRGSRSLAQSLDGVMSGEPGNPSDTICFSGDFHLYVVLLCYAALRDRLDEESEEEFWQSFCFERDHPQSLRVQFNKGGALDGAALDGQFRRFAIAQNFHGSEPARAVESVYQGESAESIGGNKWDEVREHVSRYAWFDRVRQDL